MKPGPFTASRRNFLKTSGWAAISLGSLPMKTLSARKKQYGVQLFTMPGMVSRDFRGTLELLSKIGYREIEFFGPYPFSAPETIESWKPLRAQLGIQDNAFYGFSVKQTRDLLKEFGLSTPSIHLDLATLRKNLKPMLDAAAELGVKYVTNPALWEEERRTLDDYKKRIDEFNEFGRQMKPYGIWFVYHNHGYEEAKKEGKVPFHLLLENTDPGLVKFELDVFWMNASGASPMDYLKAWPGRFKLLHLKDASEPIRFSGDGGSPDQWMSLFPKMTDPGDGVFNIPAIVRQALKSGAEHFFLERDLAPDPDKTLRHSFENLQAIEWPED